MDKVTETPHISDGQLYNDITELRADYTHLRDEVREVKIKLEGHDMDLSEIKEFLGGTKVYVAEIKEQLTNLENRLFTFMSDLVKNLTAKETTIATTEATTSLQKRDATLKFLKEVIKIVVPLAIGFLAAWKGVSLK